MASSKIETYDIETIPYKDSYEPKKQNKIDKKEPKDYSECVSLAKHDIQ